MAHSPRWLTGRVRPHVARVILLAACLSLLPSGARATSVMLPTTTPSGEVEQIPAIVLRPDGPGPFPAVVIMHDCSGLGGRSSGASDRWARELLPRGYVVFIPDSFTTRGYPGGVCTESPPGRNTVGPPRRVRDAYAALAFLRTLPYVNGQRVGLMGGSHGGTTTLATLVTHNTESRSAAPHPGFGAAVALYPGCAARLGGWHVTRQAGGRGPITGHSGVYTPMSPLLILIGEKDDWTPAEPCRRLTQVAQEAGYPVAIKVYADAHHSFDSANPVRYVASRVNANSPTGHGATTGGDPTAWADSIREVLTFFDTKLK
jgi:dienelactone hydrolase